MIIPIELKQLQLVDRFCDRHIAYPFRWCVSCQESRHKIEQNDNTEQRYWQPPGRPKIPRKQHDVQISTQKQSSHATHYKARNSIGERFRCNHARKLTAIHSNRSHCTILLDAGCYTHRNTVDDIEQRNHRNNCKETV